MRLFILVIPALLLISIFAIAQIHVHGHRGVRTVFPQSTLEGFDYGLSLGVDFLEFDLVVSKDRRVIISHDLTVNTTLCHFDQEGVPFFNLTLQEIKEIYCGSLTNFRFPQQQSLPGVNLSTLDELFELVKSSELPFAQTVQFSMEIKIPFFNSDISTKPEEFAQLVCDVIEKYDMAERSIIQSFNYKVLRTVKSIIPKIRTAIITYPIPYSIFDFVIMAKYLNAEYIFPHYYWITQEHVKALEEIGVKIVPWTVNTPRQWERMVNLGVDGIITDDPQALIEYLQEQRLR